MQHRRLAPALLLALAFAPAASACSAPGTGLDTVLGTGDGGTGTQGEGSTTEETGAEEGTQEESSDRDGTGTALGTVSVDGTEYEITEMRNCVPLEQAGLERELDLQGFGNLDSETVQIDVYVQTIGGAPLDGVSWSGPEGVFGSSQWEMDFDHEVVVEVSGDQVTGSAVLSDSLEGTETVSVEFTLPVPDELIDCH